MTPHYTIDKCIVSYRVEEFNCFVDSIMNGICFAESVDRVVGLRDVEGDVPYRIWNRSAICFAISVDKVERSRREQAPALRNME